MSLFIKCLYQIVDCCSVPFVHSIWLNGVGIWASTGIINTKAIYMDYSKIETEWNTCHEDRWLGKCRYIKCIDSPFHRNRNERFDWVYVGFCWPLFIPVAASIATHLKCLRCIHTSYSRTNTATTAAHNDTIYNANYLWPVRCFQHLLIDRRAVRYKSHFIRSASP